MLVCQICFLAFLFGCLFVVVVVVVVVVVLLEKKERIVACYAYNYRHSNVQKSSPTVLFKMLAPTGSPSLGCKSAVRGFA